jgi:hypothetical protein
LRRVSLKRHPFVAFGPFTFLLTAVGLMNISCGLFNFLLSPAQRMAGTWSTSSAVELYGEAYCEGSNPVTLWSEMQTATWTITSTGNNTVSIDETYSNSDMDYYNSSHSHPCYGYVVNQAPSPVQLAGTVNGTTLTVTQQDGSTFTFTLTNGNLVGTFADFNAGSYSTLTQSGSEAYVLTKS